MGKFTAYNLPLKTMSEGIHRFEYHLGKQFFTDMESADIHDADLTVALTVTYKQETYRLDFKITGDVTLICDRCLDNMLYPIDVTYDIDVKYGEDYSDESDELLVIPESSNVLNVSYMIHDTVALAIPIKHVHPLGKCNRQMSAMLKKHRAHGSFAGHSSDPEEEQLEEDLIDEMDSMTADNDAPTDPRWEQLKGLNLNSDNENQDN